MDNKIEFPNVGEEEMCAFFDETGSDETHGEWYYENITHFGTTNFDGLRNRMTHNLDEEILKNIQDTLTQQAHQHYINKMAIYYDINCGYAKVGRIEGVRLVTGHDVGVGKHSLDWGAPFPGGMRMNAELWFLINGKEHHCIEGVHMIDHAIPMDEPAERCFENFGDAVEKLVKLNDRDL
tara:strand:+ start:165 stop:704 length:540 start_codon:yes stop_codon:yes gene_type:complete